MEVFPPVCTDSVGLQRLSCSQTQHMYAQNNPTCGLLEGLY